MESRRDRREAREPANPLLGRRDWVYLLSLLVPFVVYDLVLKALLIASRPEDPGLLGSLGLMQSDLLFNLGYVLLWVALFAVARGRIARLFVVGLFHVVTLLVAIVTMSAYQYFVVTGSTLDSDYLLLWLSSPQGTGGAIASAVTPGLIALISAVLAYAILGPFVVTRLVERRRGRLEGGGARAAGISWLRLAGLGLVAYALFSFSVLPGGDSSGASKSFSRDAVVNVVMTAAEVAEGSPNTAAAEPAEPPPEADLEPATTNTAAPPEKRNVVLIFLESTRAAATTPYSPGLETTPFMDDLAKHSVLAQRAYTVVPHTHNALTATNCGIEPPLDRWGTILLGSRDDAVPSTCLPDLLKERGYSTAYFMSQTAEFENSAKILGNLGYDEFYPVDSMDTTGFEKASYFGYEDEVMLEPSQRWLEKQKEAGKPFMVSYLTAAPHHDYLAPEKRHGRVQFTEDDTVNRYLNAVRNQDFFLKELFDQYKQMGLYDDTVFVILGDHGEGFGEHGRFQHDNTIYEEGLKIPLLVHDPRLCETGEGCEGGWSIGTPVNQLDVLPTVADLLGYGIKGGDYAGNSLLRPLPKDRTLMASCWNESGCMASIKGTDKYIYHFGDQPEEYFDLSADPSERQNIVAQHPEEAAKRRQELLDWRQKVNSRYGEGTAGQ